MEAREMDLEIHRPGIAKSRLLLDMRPAGDVYRKRSLAPGSLSLFELL
jgi:hypothetical protein